MGANDRTFTVSVEGDVSGEKWYGSFTVKTRLTHRDHLRKDQLRRELLGGLETGPTPSVRAQTAAFVLAELAVRILKAPSWWTESDGGLDLADDNVLQRVYDEALKAEREVVDELRKAAEQAKAELRKGELPEPEAPPAG